MKKIITYSVVLVLLVSSCKKQKDLPEPEVTDPHFYVTCAMDGQLLNIAAGNDDYYMNASWYHDDADNLFVYQGNLAKQTATGYQVTILINDYKTTPANAEMDVDSALRVGDHLYNDLNNSGLTQSVDFTPARPFDLDNPEGYSWSFTDGVNVRDYPKSYSISPVFEVGKTYSVSLAYADVSGNCNTSHMNVFKAGSKVQTTITAEKNVNTTEPEYVLSYNLPDKVPGPWKCRWDFDDMTSSSNPTETKTFSSGTSIVKLSLKNLTLNDSCVSYYQLNPNVGSSCDANYKANFLPVQNIRMYSSVTILLTDPNGVVYTTKGLIQPQSSNFEIINVSDYNANEKGQPTKRVKVKFNCVVKNGNTEINLSKGEAIIAVAYK